MSEANANAGVGRRVLVTGAPGFLGSHITRQLVEAGARVRALALPGEGLENLEGVDVEVERGNVLSVDDCKRAVEGCDTVYHAAAIYESWAPDPSLMYQVNLRGTYNMLEACRRADVQKVVYTASIVALGRPERGRLGNEDTAYEAWDIDFAYSRTKHLSMLLAKDHAAWGGDVRIVCPGMVLGPGDRKPTPSGELMLALAQGKAPGYVKGGVSYVDVRDAAAGHLAAAARGRAGEAYLVTGHNLDNKVLLETVSAICGRKVRALKIPLPLALGWAKTLETIAMARGKRPELTQTFIRYGARSCYYDNAKAVNELGVEFRPFEQTVRDALDWFRDVGML